MDGIDLLAYSAGFTRSLLTSLNVQLMSGQWQLLGSGGGEMFKTREGNIGMMCATGGAKNYSIRFKMLNSSYLKPEAAVLQSVQADPRETAVYVLACGLERFLELDSRGLVRTGDVIKKIKRNQRFGPERLDGVYVSGDAGLAVTSKSHQDDYRRFVLSLVREQGRWLVEDVQIEPKQNEGDALKAFLEVYPDARPVP